MKQRLTGAASSSAEGRNDGESWAKARAKQQEAEELPLPAMPMAHSHVTPVHQDPSDPRAPQQVVILRDGKDCGLVCECVKYKHK